MPAAPGGHELVPPPTAGRVFAAERRVRLGDASPGGRARLDALVRYAQDVAHDDARDAALAEGDSWVVRRTALEVRRFPVYGEPLVLRTWCSGVGARWADRRTTITGSRGGHVEVVSLWVSIDLASGRPRPLGEGFAASYGVSAAGRTVSSRLSYGAPAHGAPCAPWPLRFRDFDVLGHVNNAACWEPVEELLARRRDLRAPLRVELEHQHAVEIGASVCVAHDERADGSVALWLCDTACGVHASAVVRRCA